MRVEIAVGVIVDHTAGGAHQHGAQDEYPDDRPVRHASAASHSAHSVGHNNSKMPIGLSSRISFS